MSPSVDFDHILRDLYDFYENFLKPVTDCKVNNFLKSRKRGESLTKNEKLAGLDAVSNLADLQKRNKWITCKDCRGIGDAIIALEQPSTHCLVHIDEAFNKLCRALGNENKAISSARAVDPIKMQPLLKHRKSRNRHKTTVAMSGAELIG